MKQPQSSNMPQMTNNSEQRCRLAFLNIDFKFCQLIQVRIFHKLKQRVVVQLIRFQNQFFQRIPQVRGQPFCCEAESISIHLELAHLIKIFKHAFNEFVTYFRRMQNKSFQFGARISEQQMQEITIDSKSQFLHMRMRIDKKSEQPFVFLVFAFAEVNIDDGRLDDGHVFGNPHQILLPLGYFVICNLELLPVLVPKDDLSHELGRAAQLYLVLCGQVVAEIGEGSSQVEGHFTLHYKLMRSRQGRLYIQGMNDQS